ncbi:alpha-2,8-sialyltransferase 8B-like [Diadema setosum]|uniref:alpha-2,8-sialyltransferase 8B-like n=1 Tax=Diadema setosum TaxID=31175 RepID=UPI003B3AACEA
MAALLDISYLKSVFTLVVFLMIVFMAVFTGTDDHSTKLPFKQPQKNNTYVSWTRLNENASLTMRQQVSRARLSRQSVVQIFRHDIPFAEMRPSGTQSRIRKYNQTVSVPEVQSCSVVGNAGVLLGSACGDVIDRADMIVRMNLAYFGGVYARDVGSKVNLMTFNSEQSRELAACVKMNHNVTAQNFTPDCERLFHRIAQINGSVLWYIKLLTKSKIMNIRESLSFLREFLNIQLSFAYSPRIAVFPAKRAFSVRHPSSGLAMYAATTQFCSRITLFGFYPFNVDPTNRTLQHHYYDPGVMDYAKNRHAMPEEYKRLLQLQDEGALRIVNDCAGRWDHRVLRPWT